MRREALQSMGFGVEDKMDGMCFLSDELSGKGSVWRIMKRFA
jgi:hypothetical protein